MPTFEDELLSCGHNKVWLRNGICRECELEAAAPQWEAYNKRWEVAFQLRVSNLSASAFYEWLQQHGYATVGYYSVYDNPTIRWIGDELNASFPEADIEAVDIGCWTVVNPENLAKRVLFETPEWLLDLEGDWWNALPSVWYGNALTGYEVLAAAGVG